MSIKNILYTIIFLAALHTVAFAEKPFFEYGGTQLFGQIVNYEDGYDLKGTSLRTYNTYADMTRIRVTEYVNFNDTSRIRFSLDANGFDKAGTGFYQSSWVYFSYLYWEQKNAFSPDTSLKLGLFATPWANWEDDIWGYRVIAPSLLSSYGITNAQDRGIGFDGTITDRISYAIAFVGGRGVTEPDLDGIMNTEGRLTWKITDELQFSLGGGSGAKTIATNVPHYYSYMHRYGVGNIAYKTKQLTLSYTAAGTQQLDDDLTVNNIKYRVAGETSGKMGSIACVWNVIDQFDLIGRLDTVDPDIATDKDNSNRSYAGVGYRSGDDLKLVATQQADINEKTNTTYHRIITNVEWKF